MHPFADKFVGSTNARSRTHVNKTEAKVTSARFDLPTTTIETRSNSPEELHIGVSCTTTTSNQARRTILKK